MALERPAVAEAYDAIAPRYAELFLRDLVDDTDAHSWLDRFVDAVQPAAGPVLDLGCGPGHGVDFLRQRGVATIGIDLSGEMLEQARAAFPAHDFRTGDLTALEFDDGSVGGIHARYSIIHLPPSKLGPVFVEWARVLTPGAPLLVSFFASLEPTAHGRPFDHRVTTAHELWPDTVAELVRNAGFVDVVAASDPPADGGRPLGKGTVLARRRQS